ncbi:MAG TPA: YiiD C-terminal domain-containing protein [Gammaproteobacteria bacterium]
MIIFPPPADAVRLLQDYLDHSIPLVPQMQVRVETLTDTQLVLAAPLAPNRNHIGTVFGGSLNGLATLSCWGLVWLALHGRDAHIVIHEGHMKFHKPATAEFSAVCMIPEADALQGFVTQYERRGRARINLHANIVCDGKSVAEFNGAFAAINAARNGKV